MIASGVVVYVSCQPVDFRKGAASLMALVRDGGLDPFNGALYVFRSKRADRVRIVWWDGSGVGLYSKTLEEQGFCWPGISGRGCVRPFATHGSRLAGRHRYAEGDDPCDGPRAGCERVPGLPPRRPTSCRQSVRERLLRKLQLKLPRRTAQWRNLLTLKEAKITLRGGDGTTTPCVRTHPWATSHRHPKPLSGRVRTDRHQPRR